MITRSIMDYSRSIIDGLGALIDDSRSVIESRGVIDDFRTYWTTLGA